MINHINKFMIHHTELQNNLDKFSKYAIYCADTESCFVNEKIKQMYENKEKNINHKGKAVKIYAWGLSNTFNDYVLYGEDLESFFNSINTICYKNIDINKMSEAKFKRLKSEMQMEIYIHNLAWDIEFMKYYLLENNFKYYNSKVKDMKKINTSKDPYTFNIVENNNIVYSANVNLKPLKVRYTKKSKGNVMNIETELFPSIDFKDSFKILSFKLDSIAKNVIKIDDKFHKLSHDYDYDKVRTDGHILTEKEKMYLYNDVYILKEFINQFYLPLNTDKSTASSISFEKFIEGKYGFDKPYKQFLENYPDLSEKPKIFNIIKKSYRGGWTQANYKYKNKHLKNINGTSIDINSSYPAIISGHLLLNDKYKGTPLPYGEPKLYEGYKKCGSNHLNLLVIEFDKFYNKDKDNFIGEIQVGSINREIFKRNGTDYIHTNIIDGVTKGTNGLSLDYRYRLYIWEFELDSILKNTVFENYKVLETLQFKCNIGHFKNIVEEYTEMKIKGKKEGNNVKQNFAKLILNSFYGKLASNYEREERKVVLENGLAKNQHTDIIYYSDKRYYPAFASCVTAWARVNLRESLYKIGYNNVLYFDTDSLYTLLPKNEVEKIMGNTLDPYILGKWDIEKTYKEFKTIGSKKYMLKYFNDDILCKCAGLPQDVREKIDFDQFKLGNPFEGKKMKTKVKGGYALIEGTYELQDIVFNV